MYILEIEKLQPGDIIFYRNPDDRLSQEIMKATKSDYSHVMLYVGNTTYIHATSGRVVSSNLQRFLFPRIDDVLVKRLSDEHTHPVIIDAACYYSRLVVGTEYDESIIYPILRGKDYTPKGQGDRS